MNAPTPQRTWLREELLHLLSLSGTLAGLCITGVTLFHALGASAVSATVADDALAISAFLFLVCTYTTFFALRTKNQSIAVILEKVVDMLFLVALTGMVAAGFIMVYIVR